MLVQNLDRLPVPETNLGVSNHIAHEMATKILAGLQMINERVQKVASTVFQSMVHYTATARDFLLNILWPYEPSEKELGLFTRIVDNGLREAAKEQKTNETTLKEVVSPVSETAPLAVSTPLTAIYLTTSYGAVPLQFSSLTRDNSFATTAMTAYITHRVIFGLLEKGLNKSFLENYQMISNLDLIDHYLYQGGVVIVAKGLDLATLGSMQQPLHIVIALMTFFPPLQKAFFRIPGVKNTSECVHAMARKAREFAKISMRPFIIRRVRPLIVPFLNGLEAYGSKKITETTNYTLGFDISQLIITEQIQDLTKTAAEEVWGKKIEKWVTKTANKASDSIADLIINKALSITKNSFELYFLNKALTSTFQKHPLLASISLIAAGGPKQSVRELAFRVSSVAIMMITGSTFLPLVVVYAPDVIDFLMTLRKKQIKKCELASDPAVDAFKKVLMHFKRSSTPSTNNPTDKIVNKDPPLQVEKIVYSPKVEVIIDLSNTIPTKETMVQPAETSSSLNPKQKESSVNKKTYSAISPFGQQGCARPGLLPISLTTGFFRLPLFNLYSRTRRDW